MSKEATLQRSLGGNMAESMGAGPRPNGAAVPAPQPVSDQQAGRSRMREAGYMLIANIVPDPEQVRKEFNGLQKLADSIKKFGVLQPIEVRWKGELGKHVIMQGERRYRAAKLSGLESIPCIFGEGELGESEKKQRQLTENCLREDLTPMEQANAFQELMVLNSWNAQQLAEALCLSKALVSQRLAVLRNLAEDLLKKVDDGTLSGAAAYQVSQLSDASAQREVVDLVQRDNLNRDQTAEIVRERKGKTRKAKSGRPTTTKTFRTTKARVSIKFNKKRVSDADVLAVLDELREQLNPAKKRAA